MPFNGYALKSEDGSVVWVDPPELDTGEPEILELGRPQHVIITFRDHERAVAAVIKKFGAKLWIPKGQGGPFDRPDMTFDETSELPANLKPIGLPACGFGEHALVGTCLGQRFAFIGDALWNFEDSRLSWFIKKFFFRKAAGQLYFKHHYRGGDDSQVRAQISRLATEDLDVLLLSHGNAIAHGARNLLNEAFNP